MRRRFLIHALAVIFLSVPLVAQPQWGTWTPDAGAFGDWRWARPRADAATILALTGTPGECITAQDIGVIYCWAGGVIDDWVVQGGGTDTDDQTAAEVPIVDALGYYAATNVELALRELLDPAGDGRNVTVAEDSFNIAIGPESFSLFDGEFDATAAGGQVFLSEGIARLQAGGSDGSTQVQIQATGATQESELLLHDDGTLTLDGVDIAGWWLPPQVNNFAPGSCDPETSAGAGRMWIHGSGTLFTPTYCDGNLAVFTPWPVSDHAPTHALSGGDEVSLDAAQITSGLLSPDLISETAVTQWSASLEALLSLANLQGDLPLGSKTSGGYAGSSTEGGPADNGDSATGFFPIGSVEVAHGGTGSTSLAAHGVVVGNGTAAVTVTGPGTAGQVLTSNGASADPTFQAAAGGATDHGALTGLGDDDHTQYALLAGRSGGQTIAGGLASGEALNLDATIHAGDGPINLLGNLFAFGAALNTFPGLKIDGNQLYTTNGVGGCCTGFESNKFIVLNNSLSAKPIVIDGPGAIIKLRDTGQVGFTNTDSSDNTLVTGIGRRADGVLALLANTGSGSAVDIGDPGTRPTCDSSVRGYVWVDEGGAGVADTVAVCAKDSSDVYAWRTIY